MDKKQISRRKLLSGILASGSAGALIGQGTTALFSDERIFPNNAIKASNSVAGVVDVDISVQSDESGVVYEISLPEEDSGQVINNNPSHVWVRSVGCANKGSSPKAELRLECTGSTSSLRGPKSLNDLLIDINGGILLSCDKDQNASGPQGCLRPGETLKLKIELIEESSRKLEFDLKFYAQQCRYNTEAGPNPFTEVGPVTGDCEPPKTGSNFCQIPCLVDPCSDLSEDLAFDNSKLPALFGDKGLSFVALCGDNLSDGDVTLNVTARNDDGEPTRVYWSVSNGKMVDQVAWKFGSRKGKGSDGGTFKRVFPDGATEGSVYSNTEVGTEVPGGPPVACPDGGDTKLKYEADGSNAGLPALDAKAGNDIFPNIKQQLNDISGINLTSEIIDPSELTEITSVRDQGNTGDIDADGTAIVGPTDGEDVIDVGGGNVTVQNYGAIIGTVTNTERNVVIKTDGAVAGDIGVEATDENGNVLKGAGNVTVKSRATVVGDIVTNTDEKDVEVKDGDDGDRSEVIGDALTSGGGSVIVKNYGRISGTAETDGGGNLKVKGDSRVGGDAIAAGADVGDTQITVGNSGPSQICGTADSTTAGSGNVDLNGKQQTNVLDELPSEPAKVFDGVRSGGQANLHAGAVSNGVVADGDVTVDNSKICGSVVSDKDVVVGKFSVITEDEDGDDIGIDTNNFNIVTDDGELGSNFENFGTSSDDQITDQTIREGSIIAHTTVSGVQDSFVGGDVIAGGGVGENEDVDAAIDIQSSVICGDIIAKDGAVDIDSDKTGPPKPIVGELDGPRSERRRRSLIGGVVRVNGQDLGIAGATVFANGITETDERDDNLAVLITQQVSGGNDATITDGDDGELQSVIKGDVVVDGELNVDIDNGSIVEGTVEANAGTVSIRNATIEGQDPNTVDDDAVIIGDGGEIDQLDGNATIEGNVRVNGSGTLEVNGPATIKGDVIQETTNGTVTLGSDITVDGSVSTP